MANAIRALAMDAVQAANSGHPGMPMGMAEIAVALYQRHLRHNPANPHWFNRDRLVVSNGHGSMLLYALLHLTGYELPMEEIKNFRQLHSKTPGHPELGLTPGVETTTGPLGQGIANAVGMALAEKLLAAQFNQPGHALVDHHTYVFLGDGCLMEGISHEVCSLAGTYKLSKLIALYDDNGISIDGKVENWFTDDTPKRFAAYGWQVIANVDGHDVDAVDAAIKQAKASAAADAGPTLICCKTQIGKGSPNRAGTAKAHGEALGNEEIALTRAALDWNEAPFTIPADVYAAWDARPAGAAQETHWNQSLENYRAQFPQAAAEFERRMRGQLPNNFAELSAQLISQTNAKAETVASRKASQLALDVLGPALPEMLGGSADLTGSNLTNYKGSITLRAGGTFVPGNHISYGVREFGMCAMMSGVALHGGYIPYGGTFLVFSDYARNALRVAALMKQRVIYVFTHDSIGLGEDGPTHQPIEHAASLRLIPNHDVWRPCDTVETAVSWLASLERADGPTSLLLSRQNLPFAARTEAQIAAIRRGGYVLRDAADARAAIIATGSEVQLALQAAEQLGAQGLPVRVVSMPSTSVFDRQDAAYQTSVLPKGLPRIAVEAGVSDYWRKYVGLEGGVVGIDRFGESAPASALYKYFDLTIEHVIATVKSTLG
ncbi:MAG: transketolase [Burkholderiaceae bacterium]|nr:MAG: transketolase [Burkholderiaceae bacterium]